MTAFNLFNKQAKPKAASKKREIAVPSLKPEVVAGPVLAGASALKNFRVSEKSSRLLELNQYTFNVAKRSNKQEIKKQIEKAYDVKVSKIRIQAMPAKSRTVGRYVGIRPGFKKAIVTLAEGSTIDQFKQ